MSLLEFLKGLGNTDNYNMILVYVCCSPQKALYHKLINKTLNDFVCQMNSIDRCLLIFVSKYDLYTTMSDR